MEYYAVYFGIAFVTALLDIIFLLTWARFYFLFGIPIYKKSILVEKSVSDFEPDIEGLAKYFTTTGGMHFRFKTFDKENIGFCEKMLKNSRAGNYRKN